MSDRNRPAAFSVLELLIVVVILALLTALLLPAVMSAREAARRMTCTNQIRQLALGCHEYLSARRTFPPGATSTRPVDQWYRQGMTRGDLKLQGANWLVSTLPYLESTIADRGDTETVIHRGSSAPDIAQCPSDPHRPTPYTIGTEEIALAKVNYAANFGWGNYTIEGFQDYRTAGAFQLENAFRRNGGRREIRSTLGRDPKSFTDGLSRTLLLSELLTIGNSQDVRGVWISATMGTSVFSARFPPNANVNDRLVHCATGPSLRITDPLRCVRVPENESGAYWATARSGHRLGVLAAMADGAVRFVTDVVNPAVWQQLSTRAGGETIDNSRI